MIIYRKKADSTDFILCNNSHLFYFTHFLNSYMKALRTQAITNKNSRINLTKIIAYLDLLQEYGTRLCSPVTKLIKV